MRLIGLDPGLRHTGWGVVEIEGNRLAGIAAGTIHPRKNGSTGARLAELFDAVDRILAAWAPEAAAVEEGFVNKNAGATLKLGYARGIVLLAPARRGLPVTEYGTNAVKKAVVGTGRAEKAQVELMVRRLLPGLDASADAADALAVAICHAHHLQTQARWQEPSARKTAPVARAAQAPAGAYETSRAKELRANATDAERMLWAQLRAKRFEGRKFRRQEPILGYVADFVCHERRLIIELDGGQHSGSERDQRRDRMLQQAGFHVLRFWNNDVAENLEGVLLRIHEALGSSDPLSPTLSPGGRGGESEPRAPEPSPPRGEGRERGSRGRTERAR
jgi:crossover junction endodeoxyribonuclease RuvC